MLLRELLEKVDIASLSADLDAEICGVSFDSRTLRTGEVFIAVRGYQQDGHQFIEEAVVKGAVCVLCEESPVINTQYVIVKDSRKALAAASAAWFGYPAESLKIIGVTGTNGKTTVTNMIKIIIEKCTGEKAGLIGTNVNMIGDKELCTERTTPESYKIQELLAQIVSEGCRYAVMEISSHALRQSRVYGIEFEVGVYTNLSPEHLDYHSSMEEYAETKSLLFKNCRMAAINIDDEYSKVMINSAECTIFTYAVKDSKADLMAKNVKLHTDGVDFSALAIGSLSKVVVGIPGMFTVYNTLAAIAATVLLGFDYKEVIAAAQTCKGVKGRAEIVPVGREFTVVIDYAHTPDALKNIIMAMRDTTKGRVVTLFGCGGDRDKKKRPMMGEIAVKYSDYVIITSDNPRTEAPGTIINDILLGMDCTSTQYCVIESRKEAIQWALANAKPGDVLILAGKGHETYQIIGTEKKHFDEREVVEEYFRH